MMIPWASAIVCAGEYTAEIFPLSAWWLCHKRDCFTVCELAFHGVTSIVSGSTTIRFRSFHQEWVLIIFVRYILRLVSSKSLNISLTSEEWIKAIATWVFFSWKIFLMWHSSKTKLPYHISAIKLLPSSDTMGRNRWALKPLQIRFRLWPSAMNEHMFS